MIDILEMHKYASGEPSVLRIKAFKEASTIYYYVQNRGFNKFKERNEDNSQKGKNCYFYIYFEIKSGL